MPNRNPLKQYFVTFPQSGKVSKEEFLAFFKSITEIDYYKVATEAHEDGSPHLHAVIKFAGRGVTKAKMLKLLANTYPKDNKRIDVKAIRSMPDSVNYLDKEDWAPLESQPYDQYVASEASRPCKGCKECKSILRMFSQDWNRTFKTRSDWISFRNSPEYEIQARSRKF